MFYCDCNTRKWNWWLKVSSLPSNEVLTRYHCILEHTWHLRILVDVSNLNLRTEKFFLSHSLFILCLLQSEFFGKFLSLKLHLRHHFLLSPHFLLQFFRQGTPSSYNRSSTHFKTLNLLFQLSNHFIGCGLVDDSDVFDCLYLPGILQSTKGFIIIDWSRT